MVNNWFYFIGVIAMIVSIKFLLCKKGCFISSDVVRPQWASQAPGLHFLAFASSIPEGVKQPFWYNKDNS